MAQQAGSVSEAVHLVCDVGGPTAAGGNVACVIATWGMRPEAQGLKPGKRGDEY